MKHIFYAVFSIDIDIDVLLLVTCNIKRIFYPSLLHKSENTEDLKKDASSKLMLPSPGGGGKKQPKDKDKKKFKKDSKKPQSRLLQERCVHCHELFSAVSTDTVF